MKSRPFKPWVTFAVLSILPLLGIGYPCYRFMKFYEANERYAVIPFCPREPKGIILSTENCRIDALRARVIDASSVRGWGVEYWLQLETDDKRIYWSRIAFLNDYLRLSHLSEEDRVTLEIWHGRVMKITDEDQVIHTHESPTDTKRRELIWFVIVVTGMSLLTLVVFISTWRNRRNVNSRPQNHS